MVGTIAFGIDELKDYAAKAGLGLQFVVKEAFLFEMMETLSVEDLVLKGGTAINKAYLSGHQRFSEDLDYDTDQSIADVRKMLHGLGWKIKREFYTRNTSGFLFAYSFNGVEDVVKVEVSRGVEGEPARAKASSDFLPISKMAPMYSFSALNFQKERAIANRHEWKDLYDLYWMSRIRPREFSIKNKKTFRAALDALSVPKTANSFIPRANRPNWQQMKEEMVEMFGGGR